jgi:L-rhamnose isomerase/sugar isomerase
MSRLRKGGAIYPIATYRASGYRQTVGKIRPNSGGNGSGIV